MRTLSRHKMFVKDMRNFRLTDTQATKLFLYVAMLLNDEPLPPEANDHVLQGEWRVKSYCCWKNGDGVQWMRLPLWSVAGTRFAAQFSVPRSA